MNVACGGYLNIYSEEFKEDDTDLDVKLDIYIIFCEFMSGDIDMGKAEDRARSVIKRYKQRHPHMSRFQPLSLRSVLETEFKEEAMCVVVKRLR